MSMLSADRGPRPEEVLEKRTLVSGGPADSQGGLARLQAHPPTLLPMTPTIPKLLRPRLARLAPATAPAAPAPARAAARRPSTQPRPAARNAPSGAALPGARRPPAPRGLLNLWALDRNGWANDYYSAAVRSMSSSWHNFLYGSFDPSGLMTVDKPPLALWVQALSARVFGFHSWSILVPQALMGVAAVALVYDLTRRMWGRTAGFVAGLVLAITPITVAISRHNNPDALLALCSSARSGALVRALRGRPHALARAGRRVRRPRLRGEDGRRAARGPRARRGLAVGRSRVAASPPCASCWRAAPRWSSSAAPGRC